MRTFPAKILLFGEYSILNGSSAITVPYSRYRAGLEIPESQKPSAGQIKSGQVLWELAEYMQGKTNLAKKGLKLDDLFSDLDKNLYLKSDIPLHYGLGSSGALVAALFDRYFPQIQEMELLSLRKFMSEAESFFHGTSSGIDPLGCYLAKPLLFRPDSIMELNSELLSDMQEKCYLLDTGRPSSTGSLVPRFMKSLSEKSYARLYEGYARVLHTIIEILSTDTKTDMARLMNELSNFQFRLFRSMIPDTMQQLWQVGMDTGQYAMKLCGSGGGGFMLVYSEYGKQKLESLLGTSVSSIRT